MRPLRLLADEYEWVHTGIGLVGNALFVIGSVLFLTGAPSLQSGAAFITGSSLMLVGTTGQLLVRLGRRRRANRRTRHRTAALGGS